MSDNQQRYRAIRQALKQLYPQEPQGNLARHLNTLAALISGIVGSKSTNLSHIASKVPDGTKVESRIKKFARWVHNQGIEAELHFLPFIAPLLSSLAARGPLLLAIDGREVSRGCGVLLVSVIYKKRALPLAWLVVHGHKGHFPEETHIQLVAQVQAVVPAEAAIIFLGDGEFDGSGDGFGRAICPQFSARLLFGQWERMTVFGGFNRPDAGQGANGLSSPAADHRRQRFGQYWLVAEQVSGKAGEVPAQLFVAAAFPVLQFRAPGTQALGPGHRVAHLARLQVDQGEPLSHSFHGSAMPPSRTSPRAGSPPLRSAPHSRASTALA